MNTTITTLETDDISGTYTYAQYRALIDALIADGKTTSGEQTAETLDYAKLNVQRMNRLDKTIVIGEPLRRAVEAISHPQQWLIISEGWCGDAAQNIPMIAKAAALTPLVTLRLILRDEHVEVMDRFLTNGTRSIPILVIADGETREVLGTWGPRPAPAKAVVAEVKRNPQTTKEDMLTALHGWYAKDKTASAQRELAAVLQYAHMHLQQQPQ
jgi:hypothetical protein